ncbi:MAG: ABC transporter substrate-binding protein [Hungatella sp.]|nr:ABC transporter substrate-binding protein [Hungatella sp.]
MKKRSLVSLALAMALTLTACGGGGQSAPAPESKAEQTTAAAAESKTETQAEAKTESNGEKVTIEFWHAWSGSNAERLDKAVEIFNSTHDNIEVVATNQGDYWAIYTKALAAIGAGESPDVCMIGTDGVGPYAEEGVLEDLTQYLTKEELDDLVPAFTDTYWGDNGELWVLSWGRSCPVLFANEDMLAEAGLKVPTTWAEVDEVSQKLISEGKTSYGFSMPYDSWYFLMIVPQMGGKLFNDDLTALGCVEDGTLAKGLQLYQDMVKNQTMYFGPTQNSNDSCRSLFLDGQSAMFLTSCSNVKTVDENASFKYSVNPVPAGDRKAVNTGGCTFGLMSASEHKQEAWEFMQWYMTAEEGAATIASQTGYIPWTKSMSETQVVKDFWANVPEAQNSYKQILDCGEDSGRTKVTGDFLTEFMSTFEAILYDLGDVNAAVEELDREVKASLE